MQLFIQSCIDDVSHLGDPQFMGVSFGDKDRRVFVLISFPLTIADRLDQLIWFLSNETISPIRQPVENINSKIAFSIGK